MGNASSSTQRPVPSKGKRVLRALTLGCTSTSSHSEAYTSDDATFVEAQEKHVFYSPPPLYASTSRLWEDNKVNAAYNIFLRENPEYTFTSKLDELRRRDFTRLDDAKETYVDYMGGSLYPDSLIRSHFTFLQQNILGNTHSINNPSHLSATHAAEARKAVLSFFNAPPGYTVVFTSNASSALKLVGESFPFNEGGCYVLGADSHNSVHGIRQFALNRGAEVHYIESTPQGGVSMDEAISTLSRHQPTSPSLFALTGQSNVSNSKNPLSLIHHAASLGYYTLLDAAALAPTSVVSLTDVPVDAMAVSFYKMFGYPTGVGALIAKESFLEKLERPWFAGGTVDIVQAPGTAFTMAQEACERFEDGTINYSSLPAITSGLQFLSTYLPYLPLRLNILLHHLHNSLISVRHESAGTPVIRILSRMPSRQLDSVGEQSDAGSLISALFLSPTGEMLPLSFIEHAAASQSISLRTGCMCNPGATAALLGLAQQPELFYSGVTRQELEQHVGHEVGLVRISLGLASNFDDVSRIIRFAQSIAEEDKFVVMWNAWLASGSA